MADDPKKTPMDPNAEPPGYKPPTSAAELLERYAKGERYFVRASASGADLVGVDLSGANLTMFDGNAVDFQNAILQGITFREAVLTEADFCGAFLRDADFDSANLRYAKFISADVTGAIFQRAKVSKAEIDASAVSKSHWNATSVLNWTQRSGTMVDWDRLPRSVVQELAGSAEGLTLYFNTRLTPFDRFLVDGVIFGVLGQATDVHVAQYEERGETAIVRLEGSRRENLERVADALWERVWEHQEKAQQAVLARIDDVLSLRKVAAGLSAVVDHLDRIELRLPSADVLEMQEDQAEAHLERKDLKVVRSWPQKFLAAVGGAVVKKATGIPLDVLGDVAKDGLAEVLNGDEEE